jgi:hypothetical protein
MFCSVPAGAYQASARTERAGCRLFGFWNKMPRRNGPESANFSISENRHDCNSLSGTAAYTIPRGEKRTLSTSPPKEADRKNKDCDEE